MRLKKLYLPIVATALFIAGCNSAQTDNVSSANPYPADVADSEIASGENTFWARENFDLQRVGSLLEKADDAEEFEYLLNSEEGINNLDLNGDGYADYISVSEYDDRYDDQRGFTLFDRFGPNEIQEIASIIFNRDGSDYPGARILLRGNEQIYGDNYNYETNWLDRALPIAEWVFGNRDSYYESPYYYNNYPDYYETYPVVETPVYRSRIEQYYPEPVFIQTSNPTITQIKIKSKYQNKSVDKIYARLAKPTKEQIVFKKNNPNKPEFVNVKREKIKEAPQKFKEKLGKVKNDFKERGNGNGNGNGRNFEVRNNPVKVERENVKPNKIERQNMKPNKVERQMERPIRVDKPGKAQQAPGGGKEKGNGNGGGNGKGNGGKGNGGGGGGKGGGKGKG